MFLVEPNPTPFDLRFRTFRTDVRVHPLFWIVSAVLGWDWQGLGIQYVVLFVACAFVSILVHELGHVLVGRWFGAHGHIVLYSFGGLAIGSSALANRWKRIAVYFGGPAAQLLIYAVLKWLIFPYVLPHIRAGEGVETGILIAFAQLSFINLYWPLLNLLPIWPLDGGRIARELLDWFLPGSGIRTSLGLSLLVSGFLAVNAFAAQSGHPLVHWRYLPADIYMGIFFALFAITNFQELQQTGTSTHYREPNAAPWERDPDYWKH